MMLGPVTDPEVPRSYEQALAYWQQSKGLYEKRLATFERLVAELAPRHKLEEAASKLAWAGNYLTVAALHLARYSPS